MINPSRWTTLALLLLLGLSFGCDSRTAGPLEPEPSALQAFEAEQARARQEAEAAFASEPQE